MSVVLERRKWTREETILALDLYFKIPFDKVNARHPEVLKLARILRRPPASLSMKIGNIGRFDPTLAAQGIVGLSHGAKSEKLIWDEFSGRYDELAAECYRIRQRLGVNVGLICDDESLKTPVGLKGVCLTHYRINQSFFRASVLSAYGNRCCITGIAIPKLLVASHIKPWSDCSDGNERTDTRNGLCLNALHDRAFDKGLFTLDGDCRIVISNVLKDAIPQEVYLDMFVRYDGIRISLPDRGSPSKAFLEYHREHVFVG